MTMSSLDDLRRDIDRVDEVLVRLLNERARCVCEIGRIKKEQNIEIYQPDREKDVLNHVRTVGAEGPLGGDAPAVAIANAATRDLSFMSASSLGNSTRRCGGV